MSDAHNAWQLSRLAPCDLRTARKAMQRGVDAVKGHDLRDRLLAAAKQIGITLPLPASTEQRP